MNTIQSIEIKLLLKSLYTRGHYVLFQKLSLIRKVMYMLAYCRMCVVYLKTKMNILTQIKIFLKVYEIKKSIHKIVALLSTI